MFGRLVKTGLAVIAVAAIGFVATMLATSFRAQPQGFEDLSPVWRGARATPLGDSTTVVVPARDTLVAFLVGTQLGGLAGTSSARCTAWTGGAKVDLGWPVQINPSVDATLTQGRELVAVAGWTNPGDDPVAVDISCTSSDSGVEHFVAVPTRTAVVARSPWFQPWGWAALAGLGAALIALAVLLGLRSGPSGDPTG